MPRLEGVGHDEPRLRVQHARRSLRRSSNDYFRDDGVAVNRSNNARAVLAIILSAGALWAKRELGQGEEPTAPAVTREAEEDWRSGRPA